MYFIDDLAPSLAELARILATDGTGVIGAADPDWMPDQPFAQQGLTVRPIDDLIGWLGRDNEFPDGVVLLTGTGIVPPDDLHLHPGDIVSIYCDAVGLLRNNVVGAEPSRKT